MSRISAIAELEDGWVGDGTMAPLPKVLDWVRAHAADIASAQHETSIIPLADGFIALVWESDDREYRAELHPESATLYVDHLDSDEIEERELPLEWGAIASEMRENA
jgi:hypothetical protein